MNKEQIYDSKISPLMKQIIEVCREHGIAMMADFAIPHDGKGPNGEDCSSLRCTTLLPDETGNNDPLQAAANAYIRRRCLPDPAMFSITHGDGSMTAVAVI